MRHFNGKHREIEEASNAIGRLKVMDIWNNMGKKHTVCTWNERNIETHH